MNYINSAQLITILILYLGKLTFSIENNCDEISGPGRDLPLLPWKKESCRKNQKLQLFPNLDDGKIDWHNYSFINYEKGRLGRGEQGAPSQLNPNEMFDYDMLQRMNGFNAALSDKISISRAIHDTRLPGCAAKKYSKNLPNISVVIPFRNEHLSVLLRTLTSIINRTPAQLLNEIIIVDDGSNRDPVNKPNLDKRIRKIFPHADIKIVRLPQREGLIVARMAGAKVATGDVLVIFDSHCEVNVNWLPPLLEPIAKNYKTCTCPLIDIIAADTFEYINQGNGSRGAFNWELNFRRLPLLPEAVKNPTEPFKSPVMEGGLLAISRKFFWELGGYDEGLQIWGGEQFELSFKIWMCGGQMLDVPCSRVGHVYRGHPHETEDPGRGNFLAKNNKRVAEVWMDEYAQFLYNRRHDYANIDVGDISKLKEIRKRNNCKSFKWYMDNVAFDLPKSYPMHEPANFAYGKIQNLANPEYCVHIDHAAVGELVRLEKCSDFMKMSQEFKLTWREEITMLMDSLFCWDTGNIANYTSITQFQCHGAQGNQRFKYDVDTQHIKTIDGHCLYGDIANKKLLVTLCDLTSKSQRWRFEHTNLIALYNWEIITHGHGANYLHFHV